MDAGDQLDRIVEVVGVELHHPPSLSLEMCSSCHIFAPLLLGPVVVTLILEDQFLLSEHEVWPSFLARVGIHYLVVNDEVRETRFNQDDPQLRFGSGFCPVVEKLKGDAQALGSSSAEHPLHGFAELIQGALWCRVVNEEVADSHQVRDRQHRPEVAPGARGRGASELADDGDVLRRNGQ